MVEFKLYTISDRYIAWLRESNSNVYANKSADEFFFRKYLGVVFFIDKYCYFAPLSSPKETDYQITPEGKKIRRSIIPIIRITSKNKLGELELKGTLRLSNMIPVPQSELRLYNLDDEPNSAYKNLVQKEMIFIRKNKSKIISNAKLLYKQKCSNDCSAGYIKNTLDFKALEKRCDAFCRK